jgi:hypothetical protein
MKKMPLVSMLRTLFLFLLYIDRVNGQTVQSLQISPELASHSERWGIGYNGKESAFRLAHFGPYNVDDINKLDSGAYKNKVKEAKGGSYDFKDGYGEYKINRIEKNALFRMYLTGESDSTETFFSVFTATRQKKETALGVILSRQYSNGGPETLSESKQAEGLILIKNDSSRWRFFINYPSASTNTRLISSGITGYMTNGADSINMKILYSVVTRKNKDSTSPDLLKMRMVRGVSMVNSNDEQIAALVFKPPMGYISKKAENYTNDELVMINKDMDKSTQLAIASLYALMIGIQGY